MTKAKKKSKSSIAAGGALAIIGGVLIIASGFRTGSFLLTAASYSDAHFGSDLPGVAQSLVGLVINGLSFLIGFGGLLAVFGGVLILAKHTTIGKILLALGGGVGFIGILISLGYQVFESGFSVIYLHVEYWIGVLIASIARYLA